MLLMDVTKTLKARPKTETKVDGPLGVNNVVTTTTSQVDVTPDLPAKQTTAAHFDAIDVRLPSVLRPIQEALRHHWAFLYRRADPELAAKETGVEFTQKRTNINAQGVQAGIEALEKKGVKTLEEKVVVFGGGYEVDLTPLLDKFKEVHVVDLCPDPLALASRKYATHPHRDRIKLIAADLSGIPPSYQKQEIDRVQAEKGAPNVDDIEQFFANMPKKLDKLPFDGGAYAMVVAPVLHESLPFGPTVVAYEEHRKRESEQSGTQVARKAVDEQLGEAFFYRPSVRDAVLRVFQHNRDELQRLTKPGGVCVFSSWMRPDEHQQTLAPDEKSELVRVGDSRVTKQDWQSLFNGWATTTPLHSEQIYPGRKPTLNLFLLESDANAKQNEKGPTSKRVDLHMLRFNKT
jgi:hypothetical protein